MAKDCRLPAYFCDNLDPGQQLNADAAVWVDSISSLLRKSVQFSYFMIVVFVDCFTIWPPSVSSIINTPYIIISPVWGRNTDSSTYTLREVASSNLKVSHPIHDGNYCHVGVSKEGFMIAVVHSRRSGNHDRCITEGVKVLRTKAELQVFYDSCKMRPTVIHNWFVCHEIPGLR